MGMMTFRRLRNQQDTTPPSTALDRPSTPTEEPLTKTTRTRKPKPEAIATDVSVASATLTEN